MSGALLALALITGSRPVIVVATLDDVIGPASASYILRTHQQALVSGASLYVLQLNTPGGLIESMRKVVETFLNSSLPVAVYVAPSGARAASAGTFITLSAHIAAMAPGTRIGAAHPVSMQGGQMDSVMARKVTNDAVAYIRSIARLRHRNPQWAEEAVRDARSSEAEEALRLGVVDLIAPNLEALLDSLDGRVVEGETLHLSRPRVVRMHHPGIRDRLLGILSNPNVAYFLLVLGFYGLLFELSNPGAIFPGVFGAISLLLAFYSFQILPVNYAGVALILLAMGFFLAEIKVPSHGVLTAGGVLSFLLGSLLLFDRSVPYLRISWISIGLLLGVTLLFFFFVVAAGLAAQRRPVVSGKEGMVGEEGEAVTEITPQGGTVRIRGEYWNAWSTSPIPTGTRVVVEAVVRMKLRVRPADTPETSDT